MIDSSFSPVNDRQEYSANCGPTSMAYCLFTLFGEDISQHDVANVLYSGATKWYKNNIQGFDPDELKQAANKLGAEAKSISSKDFEIFNNKLIEHLKTGNPAELFMPTYCSGGHWVAILGYEEKSGKNIYYVNNPDVGGNKVFEEWGKAAIKEEIDKDDDSYFAILLSRKDRKEPVFPLSKELRELLNNGSFDTLSGMVEDLKKIAETASKDTNKDFYLTDNLMAHKKTILGVIEDLIDWQSTESDFDEVSAFYDDYITVARASRIKMSKKSDMVLFTAYMTSLLTTCAWCGEL